MNDEPSPTHPSATGRALWVAHAAIWVLAVISTRLSIVNAKVDMHITGRNRAELAPEHLRQVLGGPTTEFEILALSGTIAAVVLAVAVRGSSLKWLRRVTLAVALVPVWAYLVSYLL